MGGPRLYAGIYTLCMRLRAHAQLRGLQANPSLAAHRHRPIQSECTQYVDFKGSLAPNGRVGDDLIALSGGQAFFPSTSDGASPGTMPVAGWPSLAAKPVLLLPATETLTPASGAPALPCAVQQLAADAQCQSQIRAGPGNWYGKVSTTMPVP